METQYTRLSMTPSGVPPVIYMSQNDIGRPIGFVCDADLSNYAVVLEATRTDGTPITVAATVDGNICAFETTATMTNKADVYIAQIVVTNASGKHISSIPIKCVVVLAAMDENSEGIEEDAPLYQQYTGTVQSLIADIRTQLNAETAARQAAVSAEASARQAADNQLQSNINAEASTRATTDASLQSQINQLVAPEGAAPSAAEVENARVGADGTVYSTLGDAIRGQVTDVKSALEDVESEIYNNNQPTFAWEIGSIGSNGVDIESTTAIRTVSGTYYKTDGTLTVGVDSQDVQFAVAYYDYNEAAQTYMPRGRTSWGSTDYKETAHDYIRIVMRWSDQRTVSDTSLSSHLVLSGMMSSNIDEIKADVEDIDARLDDVDDFEKEVLIKYENVFDTTDEDITDGYYVGIGGTETAYEGQSISGYIDDLDTIMSIEYDPVVSEQQTLALYDSNKAFISFANGTYADGIAHYNIPPDAKYVRFNMKTTKKDIVMLVKGNTYPTFYVAFGSPYKKIGNDIRLSNKMIEEVQNISIGNKLYEKSIAITGDSIAYGAGYTGGYGKIIGERNNMTIQNIAVAGATITDTTSISPTNMCIADSVENLNAYDYILLEGGVNDASMQVTIGEYSRLRIIPSQPTTFYGFLDKMFGTAVEMFHNKKIGFVIVHAPIYRFSAADNSEYYNAIVQSCKKWGIPFCDLNTECPPFGLFSAEGNPELYALRSLYTRDGDGWHPNEDGYKTFYCDKIEAFLNNL